MLAIASRPRPPDLNGKLAVLVGQRAEEWFAGDARQCCRTSVGVVSRTQRRVSVIYRLLATAGDQEHNLIAKQYWDWLGQASSNVRRDPHAPPRLFVRCDVDDKAPFEYASLAAIHDHFAHLADRRFGAVRPLAVLPAERTILMEESRAVSLARRLGWFRRLASNQQTSKLKSAFRHAGAWLRRYHELPPLPHTHPRHAQREEFIDSVRRVANYLAGAVGRDALLREVTDRVSAWRVRCFRYTYRSDWPTPTLHRATCLSTPPRALQRSIRSVVGRRRSMKTSAISSWRCKPSKCRCTRKDGGSPKDIYNSSKTHSSRATLRPRPPRQAVWLFEMQSLLYRWAAIAHGSQRSAGILRFVKRCRLVAQNGFMLRHLKRLLQQLPP